MNTIIATTDFTRESRTAVNYAAKLAMLNKADLILLHATYIPVVSDAFIDINVTLDEIASNDKKKMDELVKHVQSKQGPALKIRGINEVGLTKEVIREHIAKNEETLLVMGMKHIDKFSKIVFGSTATDLAGRVPCPVLVIPPDARYRPWKKIAFAFDKNEILINNGIRFVKEMLNKYESKMHYIHVGNQNDVVEKSISSTAALIGGENQTHFISDDGNTVEVLHDWVRRFKSNVIVMVARQHNLLWRVFNESHTKNMAFESSIPVLILSENKS
ncbi:MAG: universal stress protein [Flavobacteriales bacterium]